MKKHSLLLLLVLGIATTTYSKVLVWDLGGVLFSSSRMKIASSIGISRFLGYWFLDGKNPFTQVEPRLFDVLSHIPCPPLKEGQNACSKSGRSLPGVMCHWQAGTMSGADIAAGSKKVIERLDQEGYFISRRERMLIDKTIEGMFNPSLLASSMRPIRMTSRIFRECAHEINPDGTQRNINIALSNWDPDSFAILKSRYSFTFSHFDHLVISGQCGYIKPWKSMYEHLIKTHKLNPSECLFIDDQEENLLQAKKLGFNTYHMKGNYRELRRVLIEFGALEY